ncbi:MAG: dihydroxyacetone kinase subunit DhaL [Pseudomonadota bacterium]
MTDVSMRILANRARDVIVAEAETLTALDQAIGDGDHGINMRRGFEAIATEADALAELPHGQALSKAGMKLVTTVGGASGPLYGSLLMGIGKALEGGASLEEALGAGVELVKKRGKSDVGAKTMLDVLVPTLAALERTADQPTPARISTVRDAARNAREATRDMRATKGRASFLGERSIGHYDPGATSALLLIEMTLDVWGEHP